MRANRHLSSNCFIAPATVAVALIIPLLLLLAPAFAATSCPAAPGAAPTPATSAGCPAISKSTANAKAKVAAKPALLPKEDAGLAAEWKGVLDPLPAGGWKYISDGPSENPSAVYASTHSIMRNGNVVTAWIRWEFARPQAEVYPLHYLSAVTREELDCDARSYRRAEVVYYIRNNLQQKGPSFTALDDDTTWKQAIPGSEPDAMLNWGCAALATLKHTPAPEKAKKSVAEKADSSAPDAASSAPAAAPSGTDVHTVR